MKEEQLIRDGKMNKYYTRERNVQILLQLLKKYGIKKVIASPGTVNMSFVGSLQNDSFFEMYSCVDERSAAYMACGLSEESGEAVVITCTGATASRNYLSAMTEAYYRKLPIIAVTATPPLSWTGHNKAQFIDRTNQPKDTVISSYELQQVKDADDEWDCMIKVNRGLNNLKRNGGGPIHFNMVSVDSYDFSYKEIAPVRMINSYTHKDSFPTLPKEGNIGIYIGSHHKFNKNTKTLIERFCYQNNAIVLCDHTSGYTGNYKIIPAIYASQNYREKKVFDFKLIIVLGGVSGDYYTERILQQAKETWRVNEDGEIKDTFYNLTKLFDMDEETFFNMIESRDSNNDKLYLEKSKLLKELRLKIVDDIPFSNIWIARELSSVIPDNSSVHFGILNTLRSWNFFEFTNNVDTNCNVGGFGIDGCLSSAIGASLYNQDKLYFGILGDLSFFYDINSLANRHIGNNVRILLVNNGKGIEFRNKTHPGYKWGDDADSFIAAAGHFGNKSATLVKSYSESLGYKYLCAHNKVEFRAASIEFVMRPSADMKPIIFEAFIDSEDDVNALSYTISLIKDNSLKGNIKHVAKKVLPNSIIETIKK